MRVRRAAARLLQKSLSKACGGPLCPVNVCANSRTVFVVLFTITPAESNRINPSQCSCGCTEQAWELLAIAAATAAAVNPPMACQVQSPAL